MFPHSREEEKCPLPLYSEGRASLTPPYATRWLSVLYISTHQSRDFRMVIEMIPAMYVGDVGGICLKNFSMCRDQLCTMNDYTVILSNVLDIPFVEGRWLAN